MASPKLRPVLDDEPDALEQLATHNKTSVSLDVFRQSLAEVELATGLCPVEATRGPIMATTLKKSKRLTAVFERCDRSGWWSAHLAEEPGVLTQGRGIDQTRTRLREALWAWTDDKDYADRVELVDDVRVDARLDRLIRRARDEREELERARARVAKHMTQAAVAADELGISRRDAAALLGVSVQRVQQLAKGR